MNLNLKCIASESSTWLAPGDREKPALSNLEYRFRRQLELIAVNAHGHRPAQQNRRFLLSQPLPVPAGSTGARGGGGGLTGRPFSVVAVVCFAGTYPGSQSVSQSRELSGSSDGYSARNSKPLTRTVLANSRLPLTAFSDSKFSDAQKVRLLKSQNNLGHENFQGSLRFISLLHLVYYSNKQC